MDTMIYTGMEAKHRKCAMLHGQRSGNNWYARSKTHELSLPIQGDTIPVYSRDKPYPYLGFMLNMNGDAYLEQRNGLITQFHTNMQRISQSPLPIAAKIEAINTILISKLSFYFANMHFPDNILYQIESCIVYEVRQWLALNNSSTRSCMFLPRKHGGLGILKASTLYYAKRVSFLLSVLNSDDQQVRESARYTFHLHMSKRKVPVANDDDPNFGGYTVGSDGRIVKQSKVNWARSDFVELNELCMRLNIQLELRNDTFHIVIDDGEGVSISFSDYRAVYAELKRVRIDNDLEYFEKLKNQGKLRREAMRHADMSCSNQHLINLDISDKLTQFVAKGRLQLLETQAMLAIYYPHIHDKHCPACGFSPDTTSHIMSSCPSFRNMYIERHDRAVNHLFDQIKRVKTSEGIVLLNNKCITGQRFGTYEFVAEHNKPDITIIDHQNKQTFIIEVSHPYDLFIEDCYKHKFDKYMPLCLDVQGTGHRCTIIVLVIGALGLVHRRYVSGLQRIGFSKTVAKAIAKYLSLSSMIGSRRIWRRRRR